MPVRGYDLVNAAVTLPESGNFFPQAGGRPPTPLTSHSEKSQISVLFSLFSKKSTPALKAFFAAPLSPFGAASSPDGSDLMLIEGNSS
ncbi:MAG TPA: hypothetical protein VJM09_00545 [Sphingobium sp.]|nr:hypothetical protein [Sphingobium sp.]